MPSSSHHNILQAIGNTPLVRLFNVVREDDAAVYVKLEFFNPTGSYKDRMALAIIEEAGTSRHFHYSFYYFISRV